ncbi:related to retrograde regulation protein RTG2 [Cephalotrichum gorgonifer]|uniref:Related to retrograde regulation protein RTG2 n=1 Tax=Cephalotrichum gorgonifer TaxID=2041049 RepID=A0AAE8SQR4_9PEZI|nr:related to retrograde regulation protein RTG2 [Cephalotrichum gorgonifer]
MPPSTDIITLDNFRERLPPWDPDSPNQLYAIVDMGSNGIRFSITDLSPPHTRLLKCIYRERAGISLFDALSASPSQSFPLETISLVATTLSRFRSIADAHGVPEGRFSVLATEAMRKAENAAEMLAAIYEEAGVGVHVLAPNVETLFGAVMGSRSSFGALDRGGLFLDLGGGSVQMTWVDTRVDGYEIEAALAGESMPFGAARLIRVLEDADAGVRTAETGKLRDSMRAAFAKLCAHFPALADEARRGGAVDGAGGGALGGGVDVYFCGGGFRGYGSMLMHNDPVQPYPIPSVGTYTVPGAFFRDTATMRRVNEEYDGKIFGMSRRRRQQFPAVLEVIEAFIEVVPAIRTATFCKGSNREGVLLMKLPRSLRESDPLTALASMAIRAGEMPVVDAVMGVLRAAVPERPGVPTIFSLGLGPLFFPMIWEGMGEDAASNGAASLHNIVRRDPSAPGLTHLARAVLGLTTEARWGGGLALLDAELHTRLRALLDGAHEEAYFWAKYIGAVAGLMATFIPARPKTVDIVTSTIRAEATIDASGKSEKVLLNVRVKPASLKGVDVENIQETLKDVGKQKGQKRNFKVKADISELV